MFHSFLDLLDSTIPQQLVDRIGWVLIHSLWQFSLLAIFALVVLQQLHRQSASTRYFVLSTIMLGTVMTPVVTWCAVVTGLPSDARLRISSTMAEGQIPNPGLAAQQPKERSDLAQVSKGSEDGIRISNTESTIADVDHRQTTSVTSSVDRISSDLWISQLASLVHPWLPTSVFVWALGVLVFSLRPILSWLTIYRLKTVGVTAVDASILERLSMLMQTLHVNRNVTVLTSNLIHTPIVVGVLRSVILLPISLLANLPAAQVEAILAHELAHVKRYDYLVNLLQTMVETLFFYHPAVWWLSRRIRIERENCCDDLVVTALGNRVDYGKALLAVEEHLGFASTLALGARDGSLLARVQRLAGLSLMDQRSRVSGMAAFFSALILTIGVATVVIGSLAAEGDDKIIEFGTASNGLQFRLIALTPDVKDDAPELKNRVNSFKRSADMTFAVELKNVSREPITLAGLRYGEGYADETKGKLNTAMLGPFWFEFEFTDMQGKPIARTHRELYDAWSLADNASTHLLAPGESLIEVVRPAKFIAPLDYDLSPGKYQLRARYCGPSDSFRENVRKHWPDKTILKAWPHEVTSNATEFSIEELANRTKPEDLIWGKPVEGLQAALEYRLPEDFTGNPLVAPGVPVGSTIGVVFHLRNTSEKPITFISETGRQGDNVHVTNERGEKVEVKNVWFSGLPIDVAWKLQPGESAQLSLLTPGLGSLDQPGRYKVRYTVRFNSRIQKDDAGNVTFPRPGDYDKEVETGETPLILSEVKKEISASGEIQAPFRLPDHWNVVDVRFVNNDKEILTLSVQGGVNVRRWDVAARKLISEIKLAADKHGREYRQDTLQLSADGTRVLGATYEYVGIWDAATGDLLKRLPIPKKEWAYDCVRCLSCSEDLSVIVGGLGMNFDRTTRVYDGYGIVWSGSTGEVKQMMTHKNGFYFRDITVSPDGKRFATCNEHGGGVCIWETSTGKLLHDLSDDVQRWKSPNPELIENNLINSVAFSPDGKQLAVSGTFGVKFFQAESGLLRRTIDAPYGYYNATGICFSADGLRLARVGAGVKGRGYTVPIWSTETGSLVSELATEAKATDFTSDGKTLAVVNSDSYEALSLWPLKNDGKMLEIANPPVKHSTVNRVEENTHMRGKNAQEFVDRWKPVWGETQLEMQYGVAFTVPSNQFRVGERVLMVAFLRNAGDKTQQFELRPDMFGNLPIVTDSAGGLADLVARPLLGTSGNYRDTLEPGESFGPLYFDLGLGDNPRPGMQRWEPYWPKPTIGRYNLAHKVSFKVAAPNASSDSSSGDWTAGDLTSGTLQAEVVEGQAKQAIGIGAIAPQADDANLLTAAQVDDVSLPWRARGRVVDRDGKPLPGVTVRAATGIGTLKGGSSGVTDKDGRYDFRFGRGDLFGRSDDGKLSPQTQFALISASLDGHFEKNFSRQGNGIASLEAVDEVGLKHWNVDPDQVCLPDKPRELDFVMLPAARVAGTLVDKNDQPLKDYSVSLKGDKLPPGSEVLAQVITDDKGRFAITEIPTTIPYQFLIRKPRSQLQPPWNDSWSSGPITFSDPGENDLATKVRPEAGGTKELAVKKLRIKIIGEGVHGKKAVADAAEREPFLPNAVDGLAAENESLDIWTITLEH